MRSKAAAAAAAFAFVMFAVGAGGHQVRPLWVADAVCETGHNPPSWHDTAGVYEGGIRFYWGTWDAWKQHVPAARRYGGAQQAPAWMQAAVAEWGLRNVGRWGCLYHADVWAHR